ncbi:MAG: hypothetical protein JXA96_10320 [Sedimentisphaerales bacterium]|nr:hypothetical protein [Sedimentisphaerales bacterium]
MKKNKRHSENNSVGIVCRLATEKKKTVLAVCLVVLMVFMWIKVLSGKKPESANAGISSGQMEKKVHLDSEASISYVDLPEIEGRNDTIKRDIFASNGWNAFANKNEGVVVTREVNVVPGDVTESVIRKIAENLKLEAFIMGNNPRAYINDKILSVGDSLPVTDGTNKYECEVVLIENNSVVMRCGKAEVILKLKKVNEND